MRGAFALPVRRQRKSPGRLLAAPGNGCALDGFGWLEVYDGLVPGPSKGCFAQARSVGELLRVYEALDALEKGGTTT